MSDQIKDLFTANEWLRNAYQDDDGQYQWSDISSVHQEQIIDQITKIEKLVEDIGLNPDRKYSILEIDRLKTAIEWALGGGQ